MGRKKRKDQSKIYIALLHAPVYNKNKEIVTTSITGFDLHDIARSASTYGVARYYVVNPLESQRTFAERIVKCWGAGPSFKFNSTRAEAFRILKLVPDLSCAMADIIRMTGERPRVVATSAKAKNGVKFGALRSKISRSSRPHLILFGTGWGMAKSVLESADEVLEAVSGPTRYNHLSVRSAAAIVMDRLFGKK